MSITRRHLAMAGAFALGGVGLWRHASAVAASADEEAVAQAVEALRKAVLVQEKSQWEALCAEQLSDGHADGNVENKTQCIEGVMTSKAIITSIIVSDHAITIVGNDAIARHMLASDSATDGKRTTTKIGVLHVWQKQGSTWQLLAHQSVRPPQAHAS